jgi:hypothetical protein
MKKTNENIVRLLAAATSPEKDAQAARSKKYGISVRDDGNVTKPSQWASVPDSQWLDPVNYAYPCPDEAQTRAAASYWGKAEDKAKYSEADQKVIGSRLATFEKKFKIGTGTTKGATSTGEVLSFGDIRDLLNNALPDMYIVDIFPGYVIAEDVDDDEMWQIPYTVSADGDQVVLGEKAEVERQYVKVEAAARITASGLDKTSPDYGYKWEVQIAEAGPDKQGIANYPLAVLQAAVPVYDGARVFALTQGQHDDPANPYGKSVRDLVGWISDCKASATGLQGMFNISKTAKWLRDMVVDAWDRGKKDLVGLSHDVRAAYKKGNNGRIEVEKIIKVDSVDVVYDPIAGGKFLRMAAARTAGRKEEQMIEKLLAALKAQRPDLYATIEGKVTSKTVTEDEVMGLLTRGLTPPGDADARIQAAVKEAIGKDGGIAEVQNLLTEARIVACGTTLNSELKESLLPELSQVRVKKQFEGKVFEIATLHAAIKEEKEYVDKLTGSGSVQGSGQVRAGTEEPERVQAAFDKMMGVVVDDKFKDVPAFTSLRSAYTRITGDPDVRGIPNRDGVRFGEAYMAYMQLPAAYSSSTFTYALGNTMYRRLIQDYNVPKWREDILISFKRNARDFRTLESVRIGYFGDIADVDPETADYQEIPMVTDEEVSYNLNQKGAIFSVNRKVIINDDLRTVQQTVSHIGRAAKRTFSNRGWAKIVGNATYKGDSTAVFTVGHGNLGSVALTNDATGITTLANRLIAMYTQSEKDSGATLGLEPKYLCVPRAYLEIAKGLNSPWPGVAGGNPHAGRFGVNHENIITMLLTTDTNDWVLVADPNDVELLEVAFLNGQEQPELFVADNPLVGQMFMGDKVQYKIRHEYEWEIVDYRGFDKSVVAG